MQEDYKLIIEGETPAKKNVNKFNTKTKTVYKDSHYKNWYEGSMLQVRGQLARMEKRPHMIDTPVAISLLFFHGDNVRRDSDNQASSIMDLLQDAEILADDRWQIVRILNIYNHYDKGHSRCEINITHLEEL